LVRKNVRCGHTLIPYRDYTTSSAGPACAACFHDDITGTWYSSRAAKTLAVYRAPMILSQSSQPSLRKGGTSVMRLDTLNKAMIGALQDYLLSALTR